jgi:hypothetical protein
VRAGAEAALCKTTEAEGAEQRVGTIDVEHRESLLEVADRARRSRSHDLPHGQHRSEAIAVTGIHEADLLAQPRDVRAPHRLTEELGPAAARELCRRGDRQQRCLTRPVRAEERPVLAGAYLPRDVVEQGPAGAACLMPAPYLYVLEPDRRWGLTGLRISLYTY